MASNDSTHYGVIYCITNTVNGKRYIGQTTQKIEKRWAGHQKQADCAALNRAIRKYGAESFVVDVIADSESKEQLDELEREYIREYQTTNRAFGYNLMCGGSFGKHSPESKLKMSEKVSAAYSRGELREKRRLQMLGSTLTNAQKQALRDANVGKKASLKTKLKQSEIRKSLWATDAGERMRKASIEGRKSDGYKAQVSGNTKAQWADPEKREKLKAAIAVGKAAFWADPVKRAARIAKRRATIDAKKSAAIT